MHFLIVIIANANAMLWLLLPLLLLLLPLLLRVALQLHGRYCALACAQMNASSKQDDQNATRNVVKTTEHLDGDGELLRVVQRSRRPRIGATKLCSDNGVEQQSKDDELEQRVQAVGAGRHLGEQRLATKRARAAAPTRTTSRKRAPVCKP